MNARVHRVPCRRVSTVVIGGGHAGLATSHCLSKRAIDHVVLERGQVANSWRRERWDSLHLLTPNWQNRLPGQRQAVDDADGFMPKSQLIAQLEDYARGLTAPVYTHTRVIEVNAVDGGYRIATTGGDWRCRCLVLATGAFNVAAVPQLAGRLPDDVASLTAHQYRNPEQLSAGGVLVVGAASSGLQIAEEIQRSGRQVTLAVGEHVRMPRRYRGRDIQFWLQAMGTLDEDYRAVEDLERARQLPSAQLVGSPGGRNLDLNTVGDRGVNIVGRLAGISERQAQFSGSLANVVRLADLKQDRLLHAIDDWIGNHGWGHRAAPAMRPEPTRMPAEPRLTMNLGGDEIRTVVWATGFRPDYSWLKLPVFDRRGRLRHHGGVVDSPGLYAMGLPFMRRRKSSFIMGAAADAEDICAHLDAYLHGGTVTADRELARAV